MTSFFTILAGLLLLVVTKIFEVFCIDPVKAFRGTVGEIEYLLSFHANRYADPTGIKREILEGVSIDIRDKGSKLMSTAYSLPTLKIIRKRAKLPNLIDIREASSHLIYISNAILQETSDPQQRIDSIKQKVCSIRKLLRIDNTKTS